MKGAAACETIDQERRWAEPPLVQRAREARLLPDPATVA
jgi:hypothetical protein